MIKFIDIVIIICLIEVVVILIIGGIYFLSKLKGKMEITKKRKIGSGEGLIGILTKGRVSRKDYTKQAIRMAMVQIENPELY